MARTPKTPTNPANKNGESTLTTNWTENGLSSCFQRSLDLIRDRVEQVARGHHTGALIVGRPGTLKTVTANATLRDLGVAWRGANCRVTPMGLLRHLSDAPTAIHLLDDVGELLVARNRPAIQILLAALGGEPGTPRRVTYASGDEQLAIDFSGGLVLLGNEMPRRGPLLDALRSRVSILRHDPSEEELIDFMRAGAIQGYKELGPAECNETLDFLIEETRSVGIRLDLRHVRSAYEDRRYATGHGRRSWQDLVRSALQKADPDAKIALPSQQERLDEERAIAVELHERFPGRSDKAERDREWRQLTGKSPDSLYRRLRETSALRRTPR